MPLPAKGLVIQRVLRWVLPPLGWQLPLELCPPAWAVTQANNRPWNYPLRWVATFFFFLRDKLDQFQQAQLHQNPGLAGAFVLSVQFVEHLQPVQQKSG